MAKLKKESSFKKALWFFRGWAWAERQVVKQLEQAGYHVLKNFYLYDPVRNKYAEIDVLGLAGDHVVLVEVKTWSGHWNVGDFYKKKPEWYRKPGNFTRRSPLGQISRTRKVLENVLNQSFFKEDEEVAPYFIRPIVVFERGEILNLEDERVQGFLKDNYLFIRTLDSLNPHAIQNMFPTPLLKRFDDYSRTFRWRWFSKLLKKIKFKGREILFEKYLEHVQKKWEVDLAGRSE